MFWNLDVIGKIPNWILCSLFCTILDLLFHIFSVFFVGISFEKMLFLVLDLSQRIWGHIWLTIQRPDLHAHPRYLWKVNFYVTIMCRNDELSWSITKRFRAFYLIWRILLKISVITILLTFIYLVALNLLVNNQLYSS